MKLRHLRTNLICVIVIAAASAACSNGGDDLDVYIDEVKLRPGGRIEPLPTIRPAPSYAYVAADRRSPFMPDLPQQRVGADPNGVNAPDPNRPREFLEQFPLDSFRMVGSLELNQIKSGLIQATDGLVHRVTVGNHIGQNYGRVTSISDSEIQLMETVPNGLGGYVERPASIGLSD